MDVLTDRLNLARAAARGPRDVTVGPTALLTLVGFVAFPILVGYGISLATRKDIKRWYRSLKKPDWTPPDFLFGAVWPLLYTLQGLAAWMVWTHGGFVGQPAALGWYAVQLALNFAWQPVFFKLHTPGLALADAVALLGTATAATVAFGRVETMAGLLMVPYVAWLVFATALTYRVWVDNEDHKSKLTQQFLAPQEAWHADDSTKARATAMADRDTGTLRKRGPFAPDADEPEDEEEEEEDEGQAMQEGDAGVGAPINGASPISPRFRY